MDLARALADPTRARIARFLNERESKSGTVDDVAQVMGIHRTVAFEHLERLAEAGVLERTQTAGGRGRPARIYRVAGTAAELSFPPRRHRLLAQLLTSALAEPGPSPKAAARRAGRAHGALLAEGSTGTGIGEALRSLQPLGANYESMGADIHAHNCVFREACASNQLACHVQAGILEGALRVAGVRAALSPAGADGHGGCTYRIRERR